RLDHHRARRRGLPEAVYAPGKTPAECAAIVTELLEHGTGPVLLTRADATQTAAALTANPSGTAYGATVVWRPVERRRPERVLLVTAGTADATVADECAAVLGAHGFAPARLRDVGVARLHRLLPPVHAVAAAPPPP